MKTDSSSMNFRTAAASSSGRKRQLSPDTDSESEREWRAAVERKHESAPASSSTQKRHIETSTEPALPNKKRKSHAKAGAGDNVDFNLGRTRNYQYRQPVCDILPNIERNEEWSEACQRLKKNIQDSSRSGNAIQRNTALLNQLTTDNVKWGIVEKEDEDQAGGPCSLCTKRNSDCLVKLVATEDESAATGTPGYRIISRCLRCMLANGPACDLVLPSLGTQSKQEIALSRLNSKVPDNNRDHTASPAEDGWLLGGTKPKFSKAAPSARPSTSKQPKDAPRASLDTEVELKRSSNGASKKRNAKSIEGSVPVVLSSVESGLPTPGERLHSVADYEKVATAVSDINEFYHSMLAERIERNEMDFKTRSMFRLIKDSIDVVQQFTEDHR